MQLASSWAVTHRTLCTDLHWQVLGAACGPALSEELVHTGTLLSAQVSNSPVTHSICVLLEQAAGQAACPAFLTRSASGAAEGRGGDRACPGHPGQPGHGGTKCGAVGLPLQIPSGLPFFLSHRGKSNIGSFLCLFSKRQSSCQTHIPKLFRIRVPQVPFIIMLPVQRARTPLAVPGSHASPATELVWDIDSCAHCLGLWYPPALCGASSVSSLAQ